VVEAASVTEGPSAQRRCSEPILRIWGPIFIAAEEANALQDYKQMVIDGSADDIIYMNAFTGLHANYLKIVDPQDGI
jgi:hypothetical protein